MGRRWTEEELIRRGHRSLDEQRKHEIESARRRYRERPDRGPILARDGFTCRYCGTMPDIPAVDHVIPFSRGGTSDPSNLVTACKPCNSRKKNRTPEEAGMKLLAVAI